MDNPILYRRRFIPDEKIRLDNDEILFMNNEKIITKWNALKPRSDFSHGLSCYLLDKGYKISKFFRSDGELLYIYCDIIEYEFDNRQNSYVFNDLLVDVIIYADGFVKVLDVAEITEALDKKLISIEQAKSALLKLDGLLGEIYDNELEKFMECFNIYA